MRLRSRLLPETFTSRIAIGFALAVALIGAGFALSVYSYTRSRQDSERIAHTYQVINSLETTLSLTKDVEGGIRGYVVSRNKLFLEAYTDARPQIEPQLRSLRSLVADNPQQQRATDTLTYLIAGKLAVSDRRAQLTGPSLDSLRQNYPLLGKRQMDRIRQQTTRMIASERGLMQQRSAAAQQSFQTTLRLIFALSLLTLAVLLILYKLLNRELKRRAANEAQLRDYERQLQTKIQQLETSNQELERFAFVASHDMQEPLRKIQTFGNLLTQHYAHHNDADGQGYLNKMLTSADRMSSLIRDLLSFSRLKHQPEAFRRVPLGTILSRVLVDLELRIKATGAVIEASQLPALDMVPSQMEQLLTNLLSNAIKYVAPGVVPRVTITGERVGGAAYPGLFPNQSYHQLSITDNGIGFDEKYLDRIFDVFQRLHVKADYEGTGIGLAICKRVVTHHHGYITAKSQPGAGTTFIVVLPETQVNVPTTPPAAQTAARSAG